MTVRRFFWALDGAFLILLIALGLMSTPLNLTKKAEHRPVDPPLGDRCGGLSDHHQPQDQCSRGCVNLDERLLILLGFSKILQVEEIKKLMEVQED
jgi:hypothetical protein